MSFLKKLFGSTRLDGTALSRSPAMADYAQIDLLSRFAEGRSLHDSREQQAWSRVLPRPYGQQIELLQKVGWLATSGATLQLTNAGQEIAALYRTRQAAEREAAQEVVRRALAERDASSALAARRGYEARQPPLGKAEWTGPEPQLSHSALTRRILFLEHWLLAGFSSQTAAWLQMYAAEQHLWGAFWRLELAQIPAEVATELAALQMDAVEAAYWKAQQLALYVDNQETWQRCKGGDHVRRIEIAGPNDDYTCEPCRRMVGQQFLVARVPELPHRDCSSIRGCRCRYEPVLDTVEEL